MAPSYHLVVNVPNFSLSFPCISSFLCIALEFGVRSLAFGLLFGFLHFRSLAFGVWVAAFSGVWSLAFGLLLVFGACISGVWRSAFGLLHFLESGVRRLGLIFCIW